MSEKIKILMAPFCKPRHDGKMNAKNYPYWNEVLLEIAPVYDITQIVYGSEQWLKGVGYADNLSLNHTEHLMRETNMFLCIDTYLQHMGHFLGKPGVVIFGPSDPALFGYKDNINLYVDGKYFRPHQYQTWNEWDFNKDAFVLPDVVINAVHEMASDCSKNKI